MILKLLALIAVGLTGFFCGMFYWEWYCSKTGRLKDEENSDWDRPEL